MTSPEVSAVLVRGPDQVPTRTEQARRELFEVPFWQVGSAHSWGRCHFRSGVGDAPQCRDRRRPLGKEILGELEWPDRLVHDPATLTDISPK